MIKRILALCVLAVSLGTTVNAQTTFNKAKLDSLLDVLAANNKTMGSLAITQNGKIVYQKAVGYAVVNGATKTPATLKTKYRIGSISKMFTGVMVFQLIEEGKLTLDTKLDKYYPQIPNAGKITIGNMLNHHSGLHNFTNDSTYLTYMAQPQTHEQMLARITAMKPDFEPGTKSDYSNTNFVLLSYIIEKITGKPYPELVKKRIVSKIGLKDTYYGTKTNTANNEALSYNYSDTTWKQVPETDMSIPSGAGSMVSTPADLDLFIDALFTGKLISAASLEKMKTIENKYGMAMSKMPFYDKAGYGHGGAIDGFLSSLGYFPEEKMAIAFIKNGGNYIPNNILIGALSIYFNKPYKLPSFSKTPIAGLDQYVGVYGSTQVPIKITVTKDSGELLAQATGQSSFPLTAGTEPHTFVFEQAGIVMEFHPDKEEFILKQGAGKVTFTKEK
jgi:D-alanyl-D-alanine carboxypeptidase